MLKNTNLLMILFVAVLVSAFVLGSKITDLSSLENSNTVYAAGTKEAFDYLSSNNTSYCGLIPQTVDGYSDDQSIQGACCGAMDLHRYQEQVEGLKKYKNISQIPEDPYNIPVPLAKELFEYQKTITLSSDQQKIYDEAMEMSHEGGPCCCRCWRWTAFEGQAKYLITEHNFTAEQIAEVWDIEDGCGGAGHVEGWGHGH
jgi:hypothetical protein